MLRNHCTRCGQFYGVERIAESRGIPRCTCGGIIKPDVVLYEECLDDETVDGARRARHIRQADVLIIGGTSLVVYPAAGLIQLLPGPQAGGHQQGRGRQRSWRRRHHRRPYRPGHGPIITRSAPARKPGRCVLCERRADVLYYIFKKTPSEA